MEQGTAICERTIFQHEICHRCKTIDSLFIITILLWAGQERPPYDFSSNHGLIGGSWSFLQSLLRCQKGLKARKDV